MERTYQVNKIAIKSWDELEDRAPAHALVADVDLVVVRFDDTVSVLYGRCAHRGALMADGYVDGDNLICGVHAWDYRLDTGCQRVQQQRDPAEVQRLGRTRPGLGRRGRDRRLGKRHPQPYQRDAYQGALPGPHGHGG